MKINFIRHISDDILKENHELRTSIILVKQQLQNFEDNMIAFIRQSQVQIPIITTPHETLTLFMKTVSDRLTDSQLQIKKHEVNNKILKQINDQLQLRNEQLKKQRVDSSNRQLKWKQQVDLIQKKYFDLLRKYSQFQMIEQSLKQEIKSITQKNIMERNIQEEIKKKQIEIIKLACHNQLVQVRDRAESQNIEIENKYKSQISQKGKRIKELQKLMQKLANNMKLDSSETNILSSVLQAFQQSSKARKVIEDLKSQNLAIKTKLNEISKEKLDFQSKLMEKNIVLHNFQSQLEKQKIEKLQFQKNLKAKITEIQKTQKDKHVMEQYYDKKWNSDYKKVKSQLEKAFLVKSEELEKAFATRVQEFEVKMVQCLQKVNIYEHKNKELERIHNLDMKQKQYLRREIEQLLLQNKKLNSQLEQTWRMSREEILGLKVIRLEQEQLYNQHIKLLTQDLQRKQSTFEVQTQKIENTIKQLNEKHQIQLNEQIENQQKIYQKKIEEIISKYESQIKNLNEQILSYNSKIQIVKKQVSKQFQKQIQMIKERHQKHIKQKDDETQKKLQKTAHKLRDYQQKVVNTKKQHEEVVLTMELQRVQLQKQMQNLKSKVKNSEMELKLFLSDKKQLFELNSELQKKIATLQDIIKNKNKEIYDIKVKQKIDQDKAQELINKRNQWVSQLIEVQSTYQKQFEQLKNMFNRQSNIYKSKIWQLERQYKKQPLSKKNYERILSLHSEKEELKNALDIKEAQNIVLAQVNEMYETQLQMNQIKINGNESKGPVAIFTRRIDRHRKFTEIKDETTKGNHIDSKDMLRMKKYIEKSYKKQQYMSLAKARYKQVTEFQRIKTNPV